MKVGDLVRYKIKNSFGLSMVGIIIRCIPGTDRRKVVEWTNGVRCSYPERSLELASEVKGNKNKLFS